MRGAHSAVGRVGAWGSTSMLESVIALAVLVRDFEFSAPPGEPRYTNHITLRPTNGVPSLVTPR